MVNFVSGAIDMHPNPAELSTGLAARRYFRSLQDGRYVQSTGMAPGYLQGSPVIIPVDYALEFLTLCQRNMQSCPLIAVSDPGSPHLPTLGADIDVRSDLGGYRVWRNGQLVEERSEVASIWDERFVTFVIGCSLTFESAMISDGLELRHVSEGVCAPMYMTNIPLVPSGRFDGRVCVSMRPFKAKDAIRAIELTSRYPMAHGTPLHIGDPSLIGIEDLDKPLDGDKVMVAHDEIPVFWGCGITPQYALVACKPPIAITHKPGCVLVSDLPAAGDAMRIPMFQATGTA